MYEVDLVNQANSLLGFYEEKYQAYYKTKPILDSSKADQTFLKDLVRTHGLEKSKALISQYFLSRNEWFQKKAHSLDVLKRNLNVVNAELGSKAPNPELGPGRKVEIKVMGYCKNLTCKNRFWVSCDAKDVANETWSHFCEPCAASYLMDNQNGF